MESKSGNVLENTHGCSRDSVRLLMAYDGSSKRVSKTRERKERDDETELNYFGARYLDPMLGLWISVDAARQYDSPYTYVGNNPIITTDPDGNVGVVGGVCSVAWGVAQNYAEASLFGQKFNYTATDAIIDFALGFFGVSIVEKGAKIAKSAKYANTIKKTKPITYKKSGAVATKHKWANRLENAEKDIKDNAFGIVKDDVINIPGRVVHEVGNLVVDFVQNVATDKNSSQESMSTGEGIGALAPSDNTATQVDY
ncbi:MAG: RHS repeat-associated core domain-containing protein [Fibrobacter sp.]|nr:RHS repeat-associated core domain-containing protein [Fibrobacter sp.]